jgi:hypothetical protein
MTERELKDVWQHQAIKGIPMDASAVRGRAHSLARAVGRRNRREVLAGAVAIAAFAFFFWRSEGALLRLGNGLLVAGVVFVLVQLRARAGGLQADRLGDACVRFLRSELVRQRDALRSAWAWYVLPLVPGMAIFLWGVATEVRGGPAHALWLGVVIAATFIGVAVLNRWAANRLQHELERLDQAGDAGADP